MPNPWCKMNSVPCLIWWTMALVYLTIQWLPVPVWVDWYLADVLCLPLVLGLVLVGQRRLGRALSWTLPRWHGLLAILCYAIYFETILPRFSARYVGDPWDVVCYFLGWILFELLLNHPIKKAAIRRPRLSFHSTSSN